MDKLKLLANICPRVADQLRENASMLYLYMKKLMPQDAREADSSLDCKAAKVEQSYYRMIRLINNLSISSILDQDKTFPLIDGSITDWFLKICEPCVDLATMRRLDFRYTAIPDPGHLCAFNESYLTILMYQLLSNAFKYTTDNGEIHAKLQKKGQYMEIQVRNTVDQYSAGIDISWQDWLDQNGKFADDLSAPKYNQGLGLGLMICYRIAQEHDGELKLENLPDRQVQATFRFPDRKSRQVRINEPLLEYNSGFNPILRELADSLPWQTFLIRMH